MKILMIGAGASTGARSSTKEFNSPPLGNSLLPFLRKMLSQIRQHPDQNKYETQRCYFEEIFTTAELDSLDSFFTAQSQLGNTNYEMALTELINQNGHHGDLLRALNRLLAFSFTHDESGGSKPEAFAFRPDLYDQLISRLQINPGWIVISLNYDTLFEEALIRSGINCFYPNIALGDYRCTEGPGVRIFKPHGSKNWFAVYNHSRLATAKEAPTVHLIEEYNSAGSDFRNTKAVKNSDVLRCLANGIPNVPLMAHYSNQKYTPVNYPHFQKTREECIETVHEFDEAFVIGVRPIRSEENDDETVVKILQSLAGGKTTYVSPSSEDTKIATTVYGFKAQTIDLDTWLK